MKKLQVGVAKLWKFFKTSSKLQVNGHVGLSESLCCPSTMRKLLQIPDGKVMPGYEELGNGSLEAK